MFDYTAAVENLNNFMNFNLFETFLTFFFLYDSCIDTRFYGSCMDGVFFSIFREVMLHSNI